MRADRRRLALLITALAVAGGGALLQWRPSLSPAQPAAASRADPHAAPANHAREAREREIAERFQQAVLMLHAAQHEHAAAALHRLLQLAPQMPEAHTNLGFALLGLGRLQAAQDFFTSAIELNPMQANAYYGLAVALDAQGARPEAIGAMRSYLHLAAGENARHLRQARAALWEWEGQTGEAGAWRR